MPDKIKKKLHGGLLFKVQESHCASYAVIDQLVFSKVDQLLFTQSTEHCKLIFEFTF